MYKCTLLFVVCTCFSAGVENIKPRVDVLTSSYAEIERVGEVAFVAILGVVGYGRSHLRIDRATNDV